MFRTCPYHIIIQLFCVCVCVCVCARARARAHARESVCMHSCACKEITPYKNNILPLRLLALLEHYSLANMCSQNVQYPKNRFFFYALVSAYVQNDSLILHSISSRVRYSFQLVSNFLNSLVILERPVIFFRIYHRKALHVSGSCGISEFGFLLERMMYSTMSLNC